MENNLAILQFFHWYYPNDGSLYTFLTEQAAHLADLGFSMVWLPPSSKTEDGINGVGYSPYDLFDLGEFDQKGTVRTKYGDRKQLDEAIKAVHKHGMKVLFDAVLNHKAGADEKEVVTVVKVNPNNRTEVISEPYEIEAYTKFVFPGRGTTYSNFIWDRSCFSGVDWDARNNEKAIFSIRNPYGADWQEVSSHENGNYDYLMFSDIEFRNPAVRAELKYWAEWILKQVKFDGFRLDAVKHIPTFFFNEWIGHLNKKFKKEIFYMGEYWEYNVQSLNRFIDATQGRIQLFDAPLHFNMYRASQSGSGFDMRTIFDGTLTKVNPMRSITLVENHDSQPLQALESPVDYWFKPHAYALMLLRREGIPCVFFADLYSAGYTDKGADGQDHEVILAKVDCLETMLRCRKKFAYGDQYDYFDHERCIGWTRIGLAETDFTALAVVLSNDGGGTKSMEIGQKHAGKTFVDVLGHCKKEVQINKSGWGNFFCEDGSVSVWLDKEQLDKLKAD